MWVFIALGAFVVGIFIGWQYQNYLRRLNKRRQDEVNKRIASTEVWDRSTKNWPNGES